MPTPNQSKINLLVSKLKSIFASINHTHDYASILVDENLRPSSKINTKITITKSGSNYTGYLTTIDNIPIPSKQVTVQYTTYGSSTTKTATTNSSGQYTVNGGSWSSGGYVVFAGDDDYNGCEATL